MSRIVVALIWLLHWLPLSLLAPIGSGFGRLLYWVIVPRRKVVLTNLRLCFPELSGAERRALAKRHFAVTGRSMLERGLAWWASAERLRATVGSREVDYRYEDDVEQFFRHSPAVLRDAPSHDLP